MRANHRETDPFSTSDTDPLSEHYQLMADGDPNAMVAHYGSTISPRMQAVILRNHGYTLQEAKRDPHFPRTPTGHVATHDLLHWLGY